MSMACYYHVMCFVMLCLLCHAVLCVYQVIFCYAYYQRSFIRYSILKIFDVMELCYAIYICMLCYVMLSFI